MSTIAPRHGRRSQAAGRPTLTAAVPRKGRHAHPAHRQRVQQPHSARARRVARPWTRRGRGGDAPEPGRGRRRRPARTRPDRGAHAEDGRTARGVDGQNLSDRPPRARRGPRTVVPGLGSPGAPSRRQSFRPTWLFGATVHKGCDRAGYYEQGDFATSYDSPKCSVKLGCWGPVVKCNVPKRGWMNGIGGCPNVGGICIACTMPGFPDKFMPFMDGPRRQALQHGQRRLRGGRPQAARHRRADRGQGAQVAAHGPEDHHRLPAAVVSAPLPAPRPA
ncbi:hypothetical protein SHIRM173S_11424 [Streptomyces hirsutus]